VLDSEALTRTGSVIQSFFDKSGRRRLRWCALLHRRDRDGGGVWRHHDAEIL